MRSTIAFRNRHSTASGFSLLEIATVLAITLTVSTFAVISLVPVMNTQHVTNAYNTTIAALRLARDNAISQRTSYSVTFSNASVPNTIVVAPTNTSFQGYIAYRDLPAATSMSHFRCNRRWARSPAPDGYGNGTAAIDFGYPAPSTTVSGQTVAYFCPDGSSQNSTGAGNCSGMNYWSGGVVYLARGTDLLSFRAVTLWGGTGRVRGWRLYNKSGGGYQWVRN